MVLLKKVLHFWVVGARLCKLNWAESDQDRERGHYHAHYFRQKVVIGDAGGVMYIWIRFISFHALMHTLVVRIWMLSLSAYA